MIDSLLSDLYLSSPLVFLLGVLAFNRFGKTRPRRPY